MYRHLYCTLQENIIQFFRSVSLIYQQLHIHAHIYLIWYIYIYIYRHTLTSVYDIYSCVLFLHISYGFPDSLVIPQCKSGISGSPAVAVVGSPFFFTIFTMIFVCKSAWDSGIPSYPYIYIYSTYPQDSPKIYLSRVVDSQVSQFWSFSGSFSFRSGLHGGDDAQRFSWPNPVLPIHNGQARLNATPFRLWIFAAVWRSFNRLKILQLERQLHRSSLFYLKILDSLGCLIWMPSWALINSNLCTKNHPYESIWHQKCS